MAHGSWTDFDQARAIRQSAAEMTGKKAPEGLDPHVGRLGDVRKKKWHDQAAYDLLKGIHTADPTSADMYRGIHPTAETHQWLAQAQPGHEFDLPLSSFTSKPEHAADYGPVTMHVSPGSKGIHGDSMTGTNDPTDREFVSGGHYRVDSISGDRNKTIHVTQTHTHDPDTAASQASTQNPPSSPAI